MLPALITMNLCPLLPPEHLFVIFMAIWQSSFPTTLSDRILSLSFVAKYDNGFWLRVRWLPLIECHSPDALKVEVLCITYIFIPHSIKTN